MKSNWELPGLAVSNGSEQLDIASHELAELQNWLASEGRFISTLELRRQGGYRVTIEKRLQQSNDPAKFSRLWLRPGPP